MQLSAKAILGDLGLNIGLKVFGLFIGLYQLYWLNSFASSGQYAEYNLAGSSIAVLGLFAGFGIYTVLQKQLTNKTDTKVQESIWSSLFLLRLITVVVGLFLAVCIGIFDSHVSILLAVLLFLQTAVILVDYNYFAIYAVRGDVWKFSSTDLVGKLIALILLVLFPFTPFQGSPILYFVIIQILSGLVSLSLDVIINQSRIIWGRVDFKLLKSLAPNLFLIAFSGLMLGLYQLTQPKILEYFGKSNEVINGFAQAFLLINQAALTVGILNTQIASNIKQNFDQTESKAVRLRYFWKNIIGYLGVLTFGYLALLLLGPIVLHSVDSANKYTDISIPLIPILGIFVITSSLSGLLSYLNIFFHRERNQLYSTAILLLLTIFGVYYAVPNYGVIGLATVIVLVSVIDVLLLRLPVTLREISKENKLPRQDQHARSKSV